YQTVQEAMTGLQKLGLTFADDDGTEVHREIGETLGIVGDENITTTAGNGEIEVALNKDIDLGSDGSVKTGNTFIDNDGLTITGGPSITIDGIHAGDKKITGVAPGVDGTDAVNVSQLEQQETALTN